MSQNSERALEETKNLHVRMSAIEQKGDMHADRVTRLEKQISNMRLDNLDGASSGISIKNDPNHCRISFKGFSTESVESRMNMVRQFVEKYQGQDVPLCVDTRMTGPFQTRTPTNESFAQFCSRDARDRVFQAMKDKSFTTPSGSTINIYRAKTDFIRGRDWAMGKSEELIKKKLAASKLTMPVKYVKHKDARKIMVDGVDAFVQWPAETHGSFVGDFQDLQLP